MPKQDNNEATMTGEYRCPNTPCKCKVDREGAYCIASKPCNRRFSGIIASVNTRSAPGRQSSKHVCTASYDPIKFTNPEKYSGASRC